MRVLLFGTGVVALPVLQCLLTSSHELLACVTTPDRAKSRGLQVQPSPIKRVASAQSVPCVDVDRFDDAMTQQLRALQPELGIVVEFGRKLPQQILQLPTHGCLGIHPSLLPKYRGAAPIQRALYAGADVTGVTIFRVTETIDSGDILLQDMTAIAPEETAITLRERLAAQGAQLLLRAVDLLAQGEVQWHPQDEAEASQAPKLTKADGRIDWTQPAQAILNHIRGLQPWPGSYTTWQGTTLKVLHARVAVGCAVEQPGTVVDVNNQGFVVSASQGGILVTSIQLAGKRPMSAADFPRGHSLKVGTVLPN